MKSVSAKLQPKQVEQLERIFSSAYAGVQETVNFFFIQRSLAITDLKGIFSKNELTALADIHNGTMFQPEMARREVLQVSIEDAEMYEGTLTRFEVDKNELTSKVEQLSNLQVFWLIFEIRQFWDQNQPLEKFIEFMS